MAIMAFFDGDVSEKQYEQLRKEVDWERNRPRGLILHTAGFDQGKLKVFDLWDSRESLDAYFRDRLMPVMKRLGISQPKGVICSLYNADSYESLERLSAAGAVTARS